MPLKLHLPSAKPTVIGGLSREELDLELKKGLNDDGTPQIAEGCDGLLAETFA